MALRESALFIPVCPEQLGGLSTPRPAAEISGGTGDDVWNGTARVMTAAGDDRTEPFKNGAEQTWLLAQALGADGALLKARSPSCGCKEIYNGTFQGVTTAGSGVTASFLLSQGLPVFTEDDLTACIQWLRTGES